MRILKKDKINALVDDLLKKYSVTAPVHEHGKVTFKEIVSPDEMDLSVYNTDMKPTALFFPQLETLFEVDAKEGGVKEPAAPEKPLLILGMRPCDARSLQILDKVFQWDGVEDSYYFKKRNNAILCVMGCTEPRSTCFCTSVGGDPMNTSGADLFFSEFNDAYGVEAVSKKGEAFLREISAYLDEASENDKKAIKEKQQNARALIESRVNVEGLPEKLKDMFDDDIWDEFHASCIGCGTCAYICPTCHCFDILDKKRGSKIERVRFWDCCMFPLFTHHSSGHNPRTNQKQRIRQRVMHKFQYYVENFGEIACVGCGRCIINCPVNIDIRSILVDLKKATSK